MVVLRILEHMKTNLSINRADSKAFYLETCCCHRDLIFYLTEMNSSHRSQKAPIENNGGTRIKCNRLGNS